MNMSLLSKFKAHRLRSSSPALEAATPDTRQPYLLSINIESPPVVNYGPAAESLGYLLSGLLFLNIPYQPTGLAHSTTASAAALPALSPVNSHTVTPVASLGATPVLALSPSPSPAYNGPTAATTTGPALPEARRLYMHSVTLLLKQVVTYGKPFLPPSTTLAGCQACRTRVTTLARWDVLSQPAVFSSGKQAFPFSHLLPGGLPSTAVLGAAGAFTIRYELAAESLATYESRSKKPKNVSVSVKVPIRVSRSIIKGLDKNSLRIFPPSNVTVGAMLPNVVYPKADFIVELKFDGLNEAKKRWRLRRINWKIEEMVQVKANTCEIPYHQTKLKVIESHIRLNNEHKAPNSTYALGPSVRRSNNDGAATPVAGASSTGGSGIPATNHIDSTATNISHGPVHEEEEGQEISQQTSANSPFIHPHDHVNQRSDPNNGTHRPGLATTNSASSIPRSGTGAVDVDDKDKNELFLQEVRVLEKGTVREGWKSDYSGSGTIDLAIDINCKRLSTGLVNHINTVDSRTGPTNHIDRALDIGTDANCSCDISDPELGVYVTHNLILEANLAEEVLQPIVGGPGHGGVNFREPKGVSSKNNKKAAVAHAAATVSSPYLIASRTNNSTASASNLSSNGSVHSNNNAGSSLSAVSTASSNTAPSPSIQPAAPQSSAPTPAPASSASKVSSTMVPTGLTRLFRMRFKLVLTERSGFGVSWDEEVPPQYSQVSTFSPPSYGEALLLPDDKEPAELRI